MVYTGFKMVDHSQNSSVRDFCTFMYFRPYLEFLHN